MTSAPAPSALPGIYDSGDLVIANPEESCVIFVTVILVSALLEFVLQRMQIVNNQYARIVVEIMQQELTIVGVLALFLTFSISLVPQGYISPLYVRLFTWAILNLFFMACIFVVVIVSQYVLTSLMAAHFKNFEEGRMESEDVNALPFYDRFYKRFFDQYARELTTRTPFTPQQVPYNEVLSRSLSRQLVRLSNLSYRSWLSMSFVVLLNLLRANLTTFVTASETDVFLNIVMYIFIVGYGSTLLFVIYVVLVQVKLWQQSHAPVAVSSGGNTSTAGAVTFVTAPLGSTRHGIELLQVVLLTTNWYIALFITGDARDMLHLNTWRKGFVFTFFVLPPLVVWLMLPWVMLSLALLASLPSITPLLVTKIFQQIKGERGDEDDQAVEFDSDDEGKDIEELLAEKEALLGALGRGGVLLHGKPLVAQRQQATATNQTGAPSSAFGKEVKTLMSGDDDDDDENDQDPDSRRRSSSVSRGGRPIWLDPDDAWDGTSTIVRARTRADGSETTYSDWRVSRRDLLSVDSGSTKESSTGGGAIVSLTKSRMAKPRKPRHLDSAFYNNLDLERLRDHLEQELDGSAMSHLTSRFGAAADSRRRPDVEFDDDDDYDDAALDPASKPKPSGSRPIWFEDGDSRDLLSAKTSDADSQKKTKK